MSKKRYFAAFGAAGLVFAGVFGAAASLNVDGGTIQVGESGVRCDVDGGVTVESYRVDYNQPEGTAQSLGARVVGVDSACVGEQLLAIVFDENGSRLANGTADITDANTAEASNGVVFNWNVPAEDISKIQLAID